jgi:GTPase Era involved in 16S rRNA processing
MTTSVPEFAIIGHPNEGKSSVLSTLAEDDRVRISPIPGETTDVQRFPVTIDGREIIRFVDTPGFQNPRQTLAWMQAYNGPANQLLPAFIAAHRDDPDYRDDCSLLTPVAQGAGVIFVVDGARPLRNMDKVEMEILRLTGAPRLAVINSKGEDSRYLEYWHSEFRKHFNAIRVFNSSRANYAQRIELLESLKAIDQQLEPLLKMVISTFQKDWQGRSQRTAELILEFLSDVLDYHATATCGAKDNETSIKKKLTQSYMDYVSRKEQQARKAIRTLYKHNIFDLELPPHSILEEDLFSDRTWDFLGLTDKQLVLAGAISGATIGAGIDLAAAGISFGVFSALGGILGAAGTLLKGKDLIDSFKLLGFKVGGESIQVGPARNIQLLFILIDRCLLFTSHVINWAHGRRDYDQKTLLEQPDSDKQGFTSSWNSDERKVCSQFFHALQKQDHETLKKTGAQLHEILVKQLGQISTR